MLACRLFRLVGDCSNTAPVILTHIMCYIRKTREPVVEKMFKHPQDCPQLLPLSAVHKDFSSVRRSLHHHMKDHLNFETSYRSLSLSETNRPCLPRGSVLSSALWVFPREKHDHK